MRHARSYARENAVKGLYESKYNFTSDRFEKIKDDLALSIINDIIQDEENLNSYIKKNLKRWSIIELNPVLLGVLQVGTYELYRKEIDRNIIISDCLSIANVYLEKKEVKFIHFVLDEIAKEMYA